jgi:hypothetical protein
MVYHRFEVPEYHEFLDALGVAPEEKESAGAQTLRFGKDGEELVVTFDLPGRSFSCQWLRGSQTLVRVEREAAVLLRVRSSAGSAFIDVDFEGEDLRGTLEVQVAPTFSLRDQMLFH